MGRQESEGKRDNSAICSGPEEKKALAVRNWEQAIDGKDASRVLALHMVRKDAQSISSYFFCAAVYNIVQ